MGSIAMDRNGNMALGYSASSATTFPSVWYTGRLAADAAGQMPQGENSVINGTGSQTGSQRWGDYTSMNVDPDRRLHVLVREPVRAHDQRRRLASANRVVQVPHLLDWCLGAG